MRAAIIAIALAGSLCAQYPASANALQWTGATSTAGPFCWGFSCTPEQATVLPGEAGTLMVRAEYNQVYALAMSAGANRCLALPGMYNNLVLDDPIFLVQVGVCGQPSPILACPSGTDTISVVFPTGIPPGVSFSIQALVSVPSGPALPAFSFTQASWASQSEIASSSWISARRWGHWPPAIEAVFTMEPPRGIFGSTASDRRRRPW